MKLLGVTGQAGAGKDYLFAHLAADGSYGHVHRVALADTLRFELEDVLGLPRGNNVFWQKPYSPEVRAILQWYGTEFRRGQDPDYWVKQTEAHIWELDRDGVADLVVVTDVRYENEAEMIRRNGGVVAEVTASIETRARRLGLTVEQVESQSLHASEVIDFSTDYVVMNETTPLLPPGFLS